MNTPDPPEADATILPLVAPGADGLVTVPDTAMVTPAQGLGGGLTPPLLLPHAYTTRIAESITRLAERKLIKGFTSLFFLFKRFDKSTGCPVLQIIQLDDLFLFFVCSNGLRPTEKRIPPLFSFTLPNPTPLKGSFIYGSAMSVTDPPIFF